MGLILCPTREIALQTKALLDIFGKNHDLETVVVIGGVKMGPQISGLRRRPDIIVATPGRLADHLRCGNVRLDELEELVLDEADHMLDLGFLPQIREILEQVPGKHRTMMFSATMPAPIERLAQMFMDDPVRADIRSVGHVASGIEHRLYLVREEDMKSCLVALLHEVEGSTLIFTRRKLYTEWLARQLELAGFRVARIHSDRSQAQRVCALRGFREGQHRILAATDVAARGLDIPRIQHVINYGLPETVEDYVHRAGRTARGNAAGIVSSIGTWQDKLIMGDIERALGIEVPRHRRRGRALRRAARAQDGAPAAAAVRGRAESSYQRIYAVVRRIPEGRVATYGQVAALAGLPGHARQMGYALHALDDSDVPWQRVINARGEVSARSNPVWEGYQRHLLEEEGVVFNTRGRVDLKRYRWRPDDSDMG